MKPFEIEIGETDQQDWIGAPKYYAQRGGKDFAFGATPTEALDNLWLRELGRPHDRGDTWWRAS